MKPWSLLSRNCRLPSQHPRAQIPLLCILWVVSVLCLAESAVTPGLAAVSAAMAALYTWFCIKRIKHAQSFALVLAADGHLGLEQAGVVEQLAAVRWQDFGYLAVLRCRYKGKPAVYFWWCHLLAPEHRRVLRRLMNATAIDKLEKPPSLIVNPLL